MKKLFKEAYFAHGLISMRAKILFILLSVSFLLFLYLVISSRPIGYKITMERQESIDTFDKTDQNLIKVDKKEQEQNYKQEVKPIFSQCEQLLNQEEISVEQIAPIKSNALDLIVPTEYKDLHLNLLLAITKLENFFKEGEDEEKLAYQQIINQLKERYDWLN